MPKITISRDQQVLQEVELDRERMTLGRHPDNDIVIDHRAVSARHAAFVTTAAGCSIEDLGSTNGTIVNGERITRKLLRDGDHILIAKFAIAFAAPAPAARLGGRIEVLNGPHAGKSLVLSKPVTTLGKPGTSVVALSMTARGFAAACIDGTIAPTLNGADLGADPRELRDGDVLDIAGSRMQFRQGE